MVYRVVSTKLTEEEHLALLNACSVQGSTPSAFIKAAVMSMLRPREAGRNEVNRESFGSASLAPEDKAPDPTRVKKKPAELELLKLLGMSRQRPVALKSN